MNHVLSIGAALVMMGAMVVLGSWMRPWLFWANMVAWSAVILVHALALFGGP